jgi:hypothetical protein
MAAAAMRHRVVGHARSFIPMAILAETRLASRLTRARTLPGSDERAGA